MLQEFFEEVNETTKEKTEEDHEIATFSSSKDDIVNVDELEKEYQNLIIFDDINCNRSRSAFDYRPFY